MSAESVSEREPKAEHRQERKPPQGTEDRSDLSEATDEAIERVVAIAGKSWLFPGGLRRVLASPEGRGVLLDVLQPTPEELGLTEVRGAFMNDGSTPPRFWTELVVCRDEKVPTASERDDR